MSSDNSTLPKVLFYFSCLCQFVAANNAPSLVTEHNSTLWSNSLSCTANCSVTVKERIWNKLKMHK